MNGYNFTEHLRQVLAGAREQAHRLHHEYVGTEHILLAICAKEDTGARAMLDALGADPRADDFVGTEHLLLGLLGERQGIAAQVLVSVGVTVERARLALRGVRDAAPPRPFDAGHVQAVLLELRLHDGTVRRETFARADEAARFLLGGMS